jgi:prevent-host-death family protein
MNTAIGLFEAKTHLSEYVARAEAGEELVILRHNKPVAKIVPFAQPGNSRPRFDPDRRRAAVRQLAALRAEKVFDPQVSQQDLVAWIREGREARTGSETPL